MAGTEEPSCMAKYDRTGGGHKRTLFLAIIVKFSIFTKNMITQQGNIARMLVFGAILHHF
jgi:hypothetical protein